MLSRRRIRPAPGRCPAGGQAHVEAPTRIVAHIADDPVMALAFAVRQIGSAHRLGMPAQFGREVASRWFVLMTMLPKMGLSVRPRRTVSPARDGSGVLCQEGAQDDGPWSEAGKNRRAFQAVRSPVSARA